VVLLSGGLDSAVTLYLARSLGYDCLCLIFDYAQRHKKEIWRAKRIAGMAGCSAEVLRIKLPWRGSSLLDRRVSIPTLRDNEITRQRDNEITRQRDNEITRQRDNIPSTYVPARNIIFLSFALSCAEAIKAKAIFIGAHAHDYSGYPDCRLEFYRAFSTVIAAGTKCGCQGRPVVVKTPLIHKSKAQIIRLGQRLEVPFALTWSCYQGGSRPCGSCESCNFREKGFREAGLKDPALSIKKRFNFRERSR